MQTRHLDDEQLSAYIDRALAHKDAAVVTVHLEACAECAGRMQMLRATSHAVASLPETELPRPLDMGFLRDHASGAERLAPPGFVARVIHGGPPSWLPTLVAAAAILVLVATWMPRLVPTPGSQSATGLAPATHSQDGAAFAPATPQVQSLTPGVDRLGAAPLSINPSGAPKSAFAEVARNTVAGPDGSTITLLADRSGAVTGYPVQLLLRVVGGPHGTDLVSPGMEIFVAQGRIRLAGSEGTNRTLRPGEELDLTITWSAGATTGPPAPGTYSLIGRIYLKNSPVVEVPLTFAASR